MDVVTLPQRPKKRMAPTLIVPYVPRQGLDQNNDIPKKALSPKKKPTPKKALSPKKKPTPKKALSPKKKPTPKKALSPKKKPIPKKALSPKASPKKISTPKKTTPKKALSPKKISTPKKTLSPKIYTPKKTLSPKISPKPKKRMAPTLIVPYEPPSKRQESPKKSTPVSRKDRFQKTLVPALTEGQILTKKIMSESVVIGYALKHSDLPKYKLNRRLEYIQRYGMKRFENKYDLAEEEAMYKEHRAKRAKPIENKKESPKRKDAIKKESPKRKNVEIKKGSPKVNKKQAGSTKPKSKKKKDCECKIRIGQAGRRFVTDYNGRKAYLDKPIKK